MFHRIFYPETLKGRITRFFLIFLGSLLLTFGVVSFYNINSSFQYENVVHSMNLLNQYYDDLDQAMLKQKGYLYYEGESDLADAESTYETLCNTLTELTNLRTNKTVYFELQNLKGLTDSLRESMLTMYDAMEQYHTEKGYPLEKVNACYAESTEIQAAIENYYTSVNSSMLAYGNEVYVRMHTNRRMSLIFLLCTVILEILLLILQSRHMISSVILPVQALSDRAREVQQGQFPHPETEDIPAEEMDREMALLTRVFYAMVAQLQSQIEKLQDYILVQKELQESRFKELQMQINPHFMFNTLNMIRSTAMLEQADETAELLKITSRMFRYSLDSAGRLVTLFREMEQLGNYISIQELRFGDRISFEFDLDECFHNLKIPAMILQPLVENAVTHGVGQMISGAEIRIITAYRTADQPDVADVGCIVHRTADEQDLADTGYIIIEDNGVGMSPDTLEKVRADMYDANLRDPEKTKDEFQDAPDKSATGSTDGDSSSAGPHHRIGLKNICHRLQYLYGEDVRMEVESAEGQGTRIVISIKHIQEKLAKGGK